MPAMEIQLVSDTWERGSPYERYVGRWSRTVAPLFLAWLGIGRARTWLDVGCGTGALSAAILDHCHPSAVTGVEPSDGFLQTAAQNLGNRARLEKGSATAIPVPAVSIDVVVSGLVLNFVPDPVAALAEMKRVASADGTVAAYVWDYAGKMDLMRWFWDAAAELDPHAKSMDEGVRFPLCQPDALRGLWERGGLQRVETTPIDIATPFTSFEDYWQPFLGGQGPAPAYAMSLDEAARDRLRDRLAQRLAGRLSLGARAWAVRGQVPR
jgi:SAM-dependent methyltransferase